MNRDSPSTLATDQRDLTQTLLDELGEADHGLMAISAELSALVDERDRALKAAHEELAQTNSELLRLTVDLDTRIAERTEELRQHRDRLDELVKERTEALGRSEERYRTISELAQEGIWAYDADFTTTYANARLAEILGYSAEEMVGRRVFDFVDEGARPQAQAESERLRQGHSAHYEFRFVRRDGSDLWASVSAVPRRDGNGEFAGATAMLVDIADRKQAEAELARHRDHLEELVVERTAELQRSNAELQQFAYVASHDLQEPLRTISGYVGLLARRYRGQLDSDADDFIAFAVDGADRMQQLINDLLAYSRVGTKGNPFGATDCGAALNDALGNLATAIEEAGAVVTHTPLPTVPADRVQITQLFQNLLSNAIKFRSAEPPHMHVAATDDGPEWDFTVQDNGIGLEPQYAGRIFLIFQRLHGREEYPGTGIGLAICQRIVDRHGGRIWVTSQPGQGATFHFSLPKENRGTA